MSRRALCRKQESWATMLVCRKFFLSNCRVVFRFIRVSCRHFSQAEVLVTTCSRTINRLFTNPGSFSFKAKLSRARGGASWVRKIGSRQIIGTSVRPFMLADMKCLTYYILSPRHIQIAFTNLYD